MCRPQYFGQFRKVKVHILFTEAVNDAVIHLYLLDKDPFRIPASLHLSWKWFRSVTVPPSKQWAYKSEVRYLLTIFFCPIMNYFPTRLQTRQTALHIADEDKRIQKLGTNVYTGWGIKIPHISMGHCAGCSRAREVEQVSFGRLCSTVFSTHHGLDRWTSGLCCWSVSVCLIAFLKPIKKNFFMYFSEIYSVFSRYLLSFFTH
jgi:hypothetical protein